MAAGSTYTPIATTTFGGSSTSYTFTSIPSTYTDLRLIVSFPSTSSTNFSTRVGNGSVDTASNYGATRLYGVGSGSGSSDTQTNNNFFSGNVGVGTNGSVSVNEIMNYANTTTYKTVINRYNDASGIVMLIVGCWRSTSAINTLQVYTTTGTNFASGTMATLYGIAAA